MMQFSVSSWHFRSPEEWLALPHAYPIMAAAPKWSIGKRENLLLFAAPRWLVFGKWTPESYVEQFEPMLRQREDAIRRFIAKHDCHHVILLCACPGEARAERFCHRYIVADYLRELRCEEVPLPPRASRPPQEQRPTVTRCGLGIHTHQYHASLDPRFERCSCGDIRAAGGAR